MSWAACKTDVSSSSISRAALSANESPSLGILGSPAQAHARAHSPGGNKTEAACRLGIHRQYLYSKLRDLGIEPIRGLT